ncbi:hypothetical protein [Paracidovorax citrulli]
MVFRNLLRGIAACTVTAMSLLWLATSGYGQSGPERQRSGGDTHERLLPPSMERIMMRTGSPDHVRAQIERMEARARADDRLSGRGEAAGSPAGRSQSAAAAARQTLPNDRVTPSGGPGWQSQGHPIER